MINVRPLTRSASSLQLSNVYDCYGPGATVIHRGTLPWSAASTLSTNHLATGVLHICTTFHLLKGVQPSQPSQGVASSNPTSPAQRVRLTNPSALQTQARFTNKGAHIATDTRDDDLQHKDHIHRACHQTHRIRRQHI
jgi:hypothetical protein